LIIDEVLAVGDAEFRKAMEKCRIFLEQAVRRFYVESRLECNKEYSQTKELLCSLTADNMRRLIKGLQFILQ
jgi:ABC-type polysaccharide/polyol phosphate transport system ATPase subunit